MLEYVVHYVCTYAENGEALVSISAIEFIERKTDDNGVSTYDTG